MQNVIWRGVSGPAGWSWKVGIVACILRFGQVAGVSAEEFVLSGTPVQLQEVTSEVAVYFQALRFNLATDTWNFDIVVTNQSDRILAAPIVVLIDGYTGTSGPIDADGLGGGTPAKAFYDVTTGPGSGELVPQAGTKLRTIVLGYTGESPELETRVFAGVPVAATALGITRTISRTGHPVPAVTMEIDGPDGTSITTSDATAGVSVFGQSPGDYTVKFSAADYFPVWRRISLAEDEPVLIPYPRLVRRPAESVRVSPLSGATLGTPAKSIQVFLDAGRVQRAAEARLVELDAQSLPGLLPLGWSPLQALWLEVSEPLGDTVPAQLTPWGAIAPSESAVLARWDPARLAWVAESIYSGNGREAISVDLGEAGAYALVVPDSGDGAPSIPAPGRDLADGSRPIPASAGLTAKGFLDPESSPASIHGELVTSQATVTIRHDAEPLPSGMALRSEVSEEYRMRDGTRRLTPSYEHYVIAFQRPGDSDPLTLHARFPVRPILLLGPEELEEAVVAVNLFDTPVSAGTVIGPAGGQVGSGPARILVGSEQLATPTAFRFRSIDTALLTDLGGSAGTPVAGFEVTFDAGALDGGLTVRVDGLPPDGNFVLARILNLDGDYGLEPVERLRTDSNGQLVSLEPESGAQLPGLAGSGQYVVLTVPEPLALVTGVAFDGTGTPAAGLPVRLEGSPWLTVSCRDGEYRLVAPIGNHRIAVTDPATGNVGAAEFTIAAPNVVATADLTPVPEGPRVLRIDPSDGAERVPRVTSIVIEFSEPLNPGTVANGGIRLLGPGEEEVPAAISLNLKNTTASLAANTDLAAATTYRVELASTITDTTGLSLEGPREFSFTTVPASTRDVAAQLVIYEPGAQNVPQEILDAIPAYEPGADPLTIVVHGQPGVADPEVPVILANESSGETTTVLSRPDGSFNSVITGTEDDFVSATFINLNGTRVYVPVSRQEFDNGFVGLYQQGGLLEAESDGGPVRVQIEPHAIQTKTKLRLTSLPPAALQEELRGVEPEIAQVAGDSPVLEVEGPPPREGINVSMPVDLATLDFPPDVPPEKAAMTLTVVREVQGVTAFEALAPMTFAPNPEGPPQGRAGVADTTRHDDGDKFLYYGTAESALGFLPGGDEALMVFRYVLVPMLIGHEPIVVKGKAVVLQEDIERDPTEDLVGDLAAGAVTGTSLDEIRAVTEGIPLSGAYVVLHDPLIPFGLPGRLRPGVVYATTGRDGSFMFTVPVGGYGYIITATHPSYYDRPAHPVIPLFDISLAGAVYKYFIFREPLAHQVPPRMTIAHTPLFPAPGETCQLHVTASQGQGAPPNINITVREVKPLAGGLEGSVDDIRLEVVSEEVISGNRKKVVANVTTDKALQVILRVASFGSSGGGVNPSLYPIAFGGPPKPPVEETIPPSDPTEELGPLVVTTFPQERGFVDPSGEIRFYFNEPIDKLVEEDFSGLLLVGPDAELSPSVHLSDDQRELSIRFGSLRPDSDYSLTLSGASIRDLNGNPLDQKPTTTLPDSFTLRFRTAPVETLDLSGIGQGAGAAIFGTRLYALDRSDNALVLYDIANPQLPHELRRIPLRGVPRDLVAIPHYSYKTRDNPGEVVTGDLIAVVSGDLGSRIDDLYNITVPGQQLLIYDVTDPEKLRRLANPILSFRDATVVRKVRWEAPFLSYLEFGADIQAVGYINLQELIWGFTATVVQAESFPVGGRPGEDNNGDGDYVDAGEDVDGNGSYDDEGDTKPDVLPIPDAKPPEFFGKRFSYVLRDTTQKILDYASIGGATVGVTLGRGFRINPNGEVSELILPPAYRTLAFNGFEVDGDAGSQLFGRNAHPKRVAIFDGVPIEVDEVLSTPIIAVVSLAPDDDGMQRLAVVDITLPESPKLLGKVPIPDELVGGSLNSITRLDVNRIEVATSRNILVLDTEKLAAPPSDTGLHPALAGIIPGAGSSTFSYGTTTHGIHVVNEGGRNEVVQSAPPMQFVSFPGLEEVVDPRRLPPDRNALERLYNRRSVATSLFPARVRTDEKLGIESTLSPPAPASHYYVLLEAPGGAGPEIQLGLESLNMAGKPKSNLGLGFPPVRAATSSTQRALGQAPRPECDAPVRPLTAYQMSDDPLSPFYNRYLSRPFAIIYEQISTKELEALQSEIDREILWNGAYLRAFIDPDEWKNNVIGRYAAKVDEELKRIRPVATVSAAMLDLAYVMGNNPPPAAGYTTMPGTLGTVASHSGELRTPAVDMSLRSGRLPMDFERVIGGQDLYEGPFGRGWDFNYNQRLVELGPHVFPAGLEMPLIARANIEESVIGSSMDVLFHSGNGRTIHFRHVSTNTPPEYATDPLVLDFDWPRLVAHYYLPENGVFDLLVRFKDGKYERLSPDGTRFRYSYDGRLETIIDRYPKNRQELEYDRNGRLVRIEDLSVPADRFIEIGYYRMESDPDFTTGLDEVTDNPFHEGKICRLRDFAGGDVMYHYDDHGLLILREGMQVAGENGGYSGRTQTHYLYEKCRIKGVAVGEQGTPLFAATTVPAEDGKPVAQSGVGVGGSVKLDIPVENSAESLGTQPSGSTRADGTHIEYDFDPQGYVSATRLSGGDGPEVEIRERQNEHGQTTFVEHPEGRTETLVYDEDNPIFRSRGNLISATYNPGPRGGEGYTLTFNRDPRYNLPAGVQTDANGFPVRFELRSDGRDVARIDYGTAGSETMTYDDLGRLRTSKDVNGVELKIDYDPFTGYVKSHQTGQSLVGYSYDSSYAGEMGFPTTVTPPRGIPTSLTYNGNVQLVESTRGDLVQKFAYDEQGRYFLRDTTLGEGKRRIERLEYDVNGFVHRSTTDGVEVDGAETTLAYTYVPDERRRVKEIHHPGGGIQVFDYDNRGNVRKITFGEHVEEYQFDLHDNLEEVKQGGDIVSSYTYDGFDRPLTIATHSGDADYVESLAYYPGGQLRSDRLEGPEYGVVREQDYEGIDALGRPKQVTVQGDTISPTYTYDYAPLKHTVSGPRLSSTVTWNTSGFKTGYVDPTLTTVITPNALGQAERIVRREDGATFTDILTYDDMGNRRSISDELGLRFEYTARADGHYTSVKNARDHVTSMEHSSLGELLHEHRQDGMEFVFHHDENRNLSYSGDPTGGYGYSYDPQLRLTSRTLRNGAAVTFSNFDPRDMPRQVKLPDGGMIQEYDWFGRLTHQSVEYLATTYEITYQYDALGQVREETYRQDEGAKNTARFTYDKAGPLLRAEYSEEGEDYVVKYSYYEDGNRASITYPSGITVTETRDVTGRLTGVSDAGGNIIEATEWKGNHQPRVVRLGNTMRIVNDYDLRGRLVSSRATQSDGTEILAHMRYAFDAIDNLEVRQYVHRNGRADYFGYDTGERVNSAQIGTFLLRGGDLAPPLYARDYLYHPGGLDYLVSSPVTGPEASAAPFASVWSGHDAFLQPAKVGDFTGGESDSMGNLRRTELWVRPAGEMTAVPVVAQLEHNGLGQLVRIAREDGIVIENRFQPSGLRYERRILLDDALQEIRSYVYDADGRLLEEYDRTDGSPVLVARYYYASTDVPVAVDLYQESSGLLERFYFLRDAGLSVIGLADASGRAVERVWYDTFGQPVIEARDEQPPEVTQLIVDENDAYLVVLSEPVATTLEDPGEGVGIVPIDLEPTPDAIEFGVGDPPVPVEGSLELLSTAPGFPRDSVLRFTPSTVSTGLVNLTLKADILSDEWGNRNAEQTLTVTNIDAAPGTVLFSVAAATAPSRHARSTVGSPFLFQGQYFDYEAGLVYMRSRFYSPYSGQFLEPDPLGYEDSVNLYAGMGNNPVSMRDPSGLGKMNPAALARKQVGKFLADQGLTDLEIEAIINVMVRRHARQQERITLSFRRFVKYDNAGEIIDGVDTAAFRRAAASQGVVQKGAGFKAKNNIFARGSVEVKRAFYNVRSKFRNKFFRKKGLDITSDIDALHVEINGRFASVKEIRGLFKDINQEYSRLFRKKFGKNGPRPNPPFQHEAHAHLLHQVGNKVGKKVGKTGFVTIDDIKNIGHPQDAVQIEVTGVGKNFGVTARELDRPEVANILRRGRDDFLAQRYNPAFLEEKLKKASVYDLRQAGYYDTFDWPETYKFFKDGTPGL